MSLTNAYAAQNPSVISQLGKIRAEADHLKKMGVPEAQIAQHLQGRYTGTDIPAEALYAMLKNLQPPVPKPAGETIAVQAAKMVLQKAQQQQQPDLNVQQLQAALQPPPPPQQPQQPQGQQGGEPQFGQGMAPMQQGAQPPPAVQPMRKGGLADLPKPNVGNQKNFANGGIVAFDDGGEVAFKDSYAGKGLAGAGRFLGNTVPALIWDANAGVWNAGVNTFGGKKVPYVDPFDPADNDRLDSWDNLLHPEEAVKPTTLQDVEKEAKGSTWGGPPGRRRAPYAPPSSSDEAPATQAGPAPAAAPSNVRDEFIERARKPAVSMQDIIKQAKEASAEFDVEAGDNSAQNRYGLLAAKIEAARDQAIKDSRDYARLKGAQAGASQKGIMGPLMGILANRAAAAEARANANKDYLTAITGLTRGQVELDVHRTDRAMKLRDTALSMKQRGDEQAAELFAKAAELYQRGEDNAANRAMEAAYRAANTQTTIRGQDLQAEAKRDAVLKDQQYQTLLFRYNRLKADKNADPEKIARIRIQLSSPPWGIDPESLTGGGGYNPPGFSARPK